MTHVVNTGVATLRHNQNHPGSVPIPARGIPARPAPEYSFREFEGLLGSRKTPRTRHRRIRGPHHHHLPAGPPALLDQLPFHRRDRGIRRRARHARLRQELGLPAGLELVDRFVPQEPAAMPLLDQGAFGERSRPQPVVVAPHLGPHAGHANRTHRHVRSTPLHLGRGGRRFLSPVNGGVSAPNIR